MRKLPSFIRSIFFLLAMGMFFYWLLCRVEQGHVYLALLNVFYLCLSFYGMITNIGSVLQVANGAR